MPIKNRFLEYNIFEIKSASPIGKIKKRSINNIKKIISLSNMEKSHCFFKNEIEEPKRVRKKIE